MYVDFKVTVWERVWIPEDMEPEVKELVENGEIQTAQDIFDLHETYDDIASPTASYIDETEEYIDVDTNNGHSTIEIIDETGSTVFRNGTE
jgi:phosphomannomutase